MVSAIDSIVLLLALALNTIIFLYGHADTTESQSEKRAFAHYALKGTCPLSMIVFFHVVCCKVATAAEAEL